LAEITTASFAFAGTGEVDEGNAAALLDDFLPQTLGAVYRPTRVPRSNKPLSAVINWLESDDILGPKGTVPSDDLIADLLSRRAEGDDIALVVIWPAEPSEDELTLAKAAFEAGIPVRNLAAALDDLLQDAVFPPPPPAEPEPEAPAEQNLAPTSDIQEDFVRAAVGTLDGVAEQLAQNFTQTLELFVRRIIRDELAKAAAAAEPAAKAPAAKPPAKGRGRAAAKAPARTAAAEEIENGSGPATPKFQDGGQSGSDGTEEKVAYYVNPDGEYRRAKTRPRNGETRVELTLTEIDQLVQDGKIKD
jgi:pyruvate/2-oxoglutarate dehydrogenase complex dihydrolipoamide acyltransferase (E2) component